MLDCVEDVRIILSQHDNSAFRCDHFGPCFHPYKVEGLLSTASAERGKNRMTLDLAEMVDRNEASYHTNISISPSTTIHSFSTLTSLLLASPSPATSPLLNYTFFCLSSPAPPLPHALSAVVPSLSSLHFRLLFVSASSSTSFFPPLFSYCFPVFLRSSSTHLLEAMESSNIDNVCDSSEATEFNTTQNMLLFLLIFLFGLYSLHLLTGDKKYPPMHPPFFHTIIYLSIHCPSTVHLPIAPFPVPPPALLHLFLVLFLLLPRGTQSAPSAPSPAPSAPPPLLPPPPLPPPLPASCSLCFSFNHPSFTNLPPSIHYFSCC